MTDREFLMWIHSRLENMYGENSLYDYMHKLRSIIINTPIDKITPNKRSYNSLEELIEGEKYKERIRGGEESWLEKLFKDQTDTNHVKS